MLRLALAYSELGSGGTPKLTIDSILAVHRRLFDGFLYDEDGKLHDDWVGVLKPEQNYILNEASQALKFTPTPPNRTERELAQLLRWYNQARFPQLPPVVAALFFAEFGAIHPFMDGNGRVGRFLNTATLKDLGYVNAPLVPLDTRFFRTSVHDCEFLETTNAGEDYYRWTRYFANQAELAYRAAPKQANLGPIVSHFSRESTRRILSSVLAGTGEWFSRSDISNPSK